MNKVAFFHIAKTAGSSLNAMLRANYGERYFGCVQPCGSHAKGVELFRSMTPDEQDKYDCVSGHMPIDFLRGLRGRYKTFVFLRNPVDRVLSLYRFYTCVDANEVRAELRAKTKTVRDFLQNEGGRETNNGMVRTLCGHWSPQETGHDRDLLEQAKSVLETDFDFLGLQERFSESIRMLADRFGMGRCIEKQVNVSSAGREAPAAADREAVASLNTLDVELYDHAVSLFRRQVANH